MSQPRMIMVERKASLENPQGDWPLQCEDDYSQYGDQGHSMSMQMVRIRKVNIYEPPALAAFPTVLQMDQFDTRKKIVSFN